MTNSVGERANGGLWRVSMSPGDTHPGCKADTYCIDKVFISSQLWGHEAYIMLRWHSAESSHPGWQLCCFHKTRLPFHSMPLPWYVDARGWKACLLKACGGIIAAVWWEGEGGSCSQVTVVLGGCLLNLISRKSSCKGCLEAISIFFFFLVFLSEVQQCNPFQFSP